MAADVSAEIGAEKYISLTTFRRSGAAVPSAVWVVPASDGRVAVRTGSKSGKIKRARNNPSVTLQASDSRGRVREGAPVVNGTSELVTSGPEFDAAGTAIKSKYGLMVPIGNFFARLAQLRKGKQPHGDIVLLITPTA